MTCHETNNIYYMVWTSEEVQILTGQFLRIS